MGLGDADSPDLAEKRFKADNILRDSTLRDLDGRAAAVVPGPHHRAIRQTCAFHVIKRLLFLDTTILLGVILRLMRRCNARWLKRGSEIFFKHRIQTQQLLFQKHEFKIAFRLFALFVEWDLFQIAGQLAEVHERGSLPGAILAWINFLKFSTGCAPTTGLPLMKKVGVPCTPSEAAIFMSSFTRSFVFS